MQEILKSITPISFEAFRFEAFKANHLNDIRKKFALEVAPVATTSVSSVKHVRFVDGIRIDFDRVVIPLSETYDSGSFAYDFYRSVSDADRYIYETAKVQVKQKVAGGWVPVRLDVWCSQGRKSKSAKPVRLDVWFVTKTDSVNQNATRYNQSSIRPSIRHSSSGNLYLGIYEENHSENQDRHSEVSVVSGR